MLCPEELFLNVFGQLTGKEYPGGGKGCVEIMAANVGSDIYIYI